MVIYKVPGNDEQRRIILNRSMAVLSCWSVERQRGGRVLLERDGRSVVVDENLPGRGRLDELSGGG